MNMEDEFEVETDAMADRDDDLYDMNEMAGDAFYDQYDDDPNPYAGTYSEE